MSASFLLNDGRSIPAVGLGTWNSTEEGEVKNAVLTALKAGYKHIDCAWVYKNEKEIGVAFQEAFSTGLIKREDLFVTSKLWNDFHASEDVEKACRESLADLQLEYLDLYLIHWPATWIQGPVLTPGIQETWLAMEQLVAKGLVRTIGVSNFSVSKLTAMKEYATIFPAVNQVELHPKWRQDELKEKCAALGTHLTAYSPLGTPGTADMIGHNGASVLANPTVVAVAGETNKTPAQVVIRWAVQRGTSVVPKSSTPERIASNFDVFSWELSADQMHRLSSIEEQTRLLQGGIFINPVGPYVTTDQIWV